MLESIYQIKDSVNPKLDLLGVVRTMYDSRNSLAVEVSAQLKKYFHDKLFWTFIPRNVRLAEAPSHGMSALKYDPNCSGSKAYLSLAKEVAKKTMVFLATSLARDKYALEPEQLGSYFRADIPWLGASARRTLRGINVQKSLS